MSSSKDYYDNIYSSEEYQNWEAAPGKKVVVNAAQKLHAHGKLVQDAKIIDIGCGAGYLMNQVDQAIEGNQFDFYGVDFSNEAIKAANQLAKPKYQFISEDGSFDLLLSYGTYEHFEDPSAGIKEAARFVAPRRHCPLPAANPRGVPHRSHR